MPKPSLTYPLRSSELISPRWGTLDGDNGNARPGRGSNALAEARRRREEVIADIQPQDYMLSDIDEEDINSEIHVFGLSSSSKPPSTRGMSASAVGGHIPSSPPGVEEPIRGRVSHVNTPADFGITSEQKRLSQRRYGRQKCHLLCASPSLFLPDTHSVLLVMPGLLEKSLTKKNSS